MTESSRKGAKYAKILGCDSYLQFTRQVSSLNQHTHNEHALGDYGKASFQDGCGRAIVLLKQYLSCTTEIFTT